MVKRTGIGTTSGLAKSPESRTTSLGSCALRRRVHSNKVVATEQTYQRFNFLVKEGYFVEHRASGDGKYVGITFSANTSGLIITKERPCGSQVIISERDASFRIDMRRSGKISRLLRVLSSVELLVS